MLMQKREDNDLSNHPALDTVNVQPDTINYPGPNPDSTLNPTDTVIQNRS